MPTTAAINIRVDTLLVQQIKWGRGGHRLSPYRLITPPPYRFTPYRKIKGKKSERMLLVGKSSSSPSSKREKA